MAVCNFEGNSDMYGLGIRLGFYLQWYAAILARWIVPLPSEVKSLGFSLNLFVAATFLALIILTTNNVESLQPVETYIVLLLLFGAYLALVPIYLWRLLTGCDPYWDPTRYPIVNMGALSANLNFFLLIGVLIFQYWFWFDRVPDLDHYNCQQYGFLLSQVRLNSKVSVVLNALMYFWLGVVCLYLLALKILHVLGFPDPSDQRKRRVISRSHKERHIDLLQNFDNWIRIIVAIMVTLATELTISWNQIEGTNTLSGAGNTIPFVIGIGAIVRVLYVSAFYDTDDGSDGDSYSGYGSGRPHRGGPSPLPDRQMPDIRYVRRPQRPRRDPIPVRRMPSVLSVEETGRRHG
ncbi:hypothetical protein K458DRAFT_422828 [Lentithecium fluviatile CBS 122367]|uniref:Uncharacterized protein n=1 Tax=Lentithecium fluviatile CBS 122367 TaxID=1168545 RepID=A0A6G1IKX7_9PLEO|nr:hypothetical protein K458DRAFT_422828 [Lentithecium fluviatile CBS 122367]